MPFTLLKTLSEVSEADPFMSRRLVLTSMPNHVAQSSTYRPSSGVPAPKSSFAALNQLYRSGGIKSLWRGAVPTALRDAPGAGLFIVFYERGRRLLGVRGDSGGGALGGGMAGVHRKIAMLDSVIRTDTTLNRRCLGITLIHVDDHTIRPNQDAAADLAIGVSNAGFLYKLDIPHKWHSRVLGRMTL